MQTRNQWRHGSRDLQVPLLPTHLQGSGGCMLAQAIFDSKVGPEVYLAILEEPSWCLPLAATRPFRIFCESGLARTNSGGLIFLIWRIAGESSNEVVHEQFLNPYNATAIQDLSAVARQTHLKALNINSSASEVIDWFEFENYFKLDELLDNALAMIGREPAGDFAAAIEEFTRRYSIEELLRA